MKKKLKKYIDKNLDVEKTSLFSRIGSFISGDKYKYYDEDISYDLDTTRVEENYYDSTEDVDVPVFLKRQGSMNQESTRIRNFIDSYADYNDFQTLLFKYIDDRGLKDSDVYNKVHIDRRLFSKIRSSKDYHPSKDTVILLGFALKLSEKEIDALLESASYSMPKNNYFDLIIRFCFIHKVYELSEVNDLLDEYDCRLFSY